MPKPRSAACTRSLREGTRDAGRCIDCLTEPPDVRAGFTLLRCKECGSYHADREKRRRVEARERAPLLGLSFAGLFARMAERKRERREGLGL